MRPLPVPLMYRMFKKLLPLTRWYWRVQVRGEENIPASGGGILAANHGSFLDPWFIGTHLPRRFYRYLINERWYYRSPGWNRFFRWGGPVPVAANNIRENERRIIQAVAAGDMLCMFPEGRITHDGKLSPGKRGIGYIAAKSGAPIIPCGVNGSYQALPRHKRWPSRHPLRIAVGEPLVFPGSPVERPDKEEVAAFVNNLMSRIQELLDSWD